MFWRRPSPRPTDPIECLVLDVHRLIWFALERRRRQPEVPAVCWAALDADEDALRHLFTVIARGQMTRPTWRAMFRLQAALDDEQRIPLLARLTRKQPSDTKETTL